MKKFVDNLTKGVRSPLGLWTPDMLHKHIDMHLTKWLHLTQVEAKAMGIKYS